MKTIVIAGARSGVGKSSLAQAIISLLPRSLWIKIGHHPGNPSKKNHYFRRGTPYPEIVKSIPKTRYLIIESNAILDQIKPDCTIYLAADAAKPSAKKALKIADIVRAESVPAATIRSLSKKLDVPEALVRKIAWLAGARPLPVTAIILAGGKSLRMGTDKSCLRIDGTLLINHLYFLVKPFFDDVIISGTPAAPAIEGSRFVADGFSDCGPLAGIHASLCALSTPLGFVIACDIPRVSFPVLFKLLSLSGDYDVVMPSFKQGECEPLFAVYHKKTACIAGELLLQGRFRVSGIAQGAKTHIEPFRNQNWYVNLNTPDDYRNFIRGKKR